MSYRNCFAIIVVCIALCASAHAGPIKALIVDGQNNHDWKGTTPMLKKQLEETGLFSVDVVTSPEKGKSMDGFNPQFSKYDVVVSNYTGDPWPERVKKALEDYVAGGGGLVIYHAANNAFADWKAYNEMIAVGGWGGRNEKHGPYIYWRDGKVVRDMEPGRGGSHGPQHEFVIVVREPNHPITRGLPEKFMHSSDELYCKLRGPAKNLTLLATAFSPKDKRGTGRHEPMLMTIAYGKGRVFHTAFGHGPKQLHSVAFIVTFQRGTEWAATGKVTQKLPKDFPGPDKPSMR
ncbi:MAG: ThuA domain-containing protein [Pirellulales bacterium]|nr:ThuA domain-containing protein [Pirellulales bacterium]